MVKTIIGQATKTVAWILISVGACMASGGATELELDRALLDIKATAQLIAERAATAAAALEQLQARSQALRSEILQEGRRGGAATYRQAAQIRRIHFDLRLLQQVADYQTQLEDRLAYFRAATAHLNACREQVLDDRLMQRALEHVPDSELPGQIREAIKGYRRQCDAPLLNARSASGPRELERLWNDILKAP